MPRRYLPLKPKQVCTILEKRGFKIANKTGDHLIYELDVPDGDPPNVHVNMGDKDFGVREMKRIINNSGLSHDEFYGTIKKIAQKAGVKFLLNKKK